MVVYDELKLIAEINQKRTELSNILFKKMDLDGLHLDSAVIIKNCITENGHLYNADGEQLDNCGLVDEEYYCSQSKGYIDDDYYGTLYYATDEEGVFVKIPFTAY